MLTFKIHLHHVNMLEDVILINYIRFFIDNVKCKHIIITASDT